MKGELPAAIQKKQKRIAALEQELASLKQEMADAKALLSGRVSVNLSTGRVEPRQTKNRTRSIRESSAVGIALKALRASGQPMHIDSLLKFMSMHFDVEPNKATLVSGLSRYVKAGDTFTRPRESIYGLVEFESEERPH